MDSPTQKPAGDEILQAAESITAGKPTGGNCFCSFSQYTQHTYFLTAPLTPPLSLPTSNLSFPSFPRLFISLRHPHSCSLLPSLSLVPAVLPVSLLFPLPPALSYEVKSCQKDARRCIQKADGGQHTHGVKSARDKMGTAGENVTAVEGNTEGVRPPDSLQNLTPKVYFLILFNALPLPFFSPSLIHLHYSRPRFPLFPFSVLRSN